MRISYVEHLERISQAAGLGSVVRFIFALTFGRDSDRRGDDAAGGPGRGPLWRPLADGRWRDGGGHRIHADESGRRVLEFGMVHAPRKTYRGIRLTASRDQA